MMAIPSRHCCSHLAGKETDPRRVHNVAEVIVEVVGFLWGVCIVYK
jgi:hypothetical protein